MGNAPSDKTAVTGSASKHPEVYLSHSGSAKPPPSISVAQVKVALGMAAGDYKRVYKLIEDAVLPADRGFDRIDVESIVDEIEELLDDAGDRQLHSTLLDVCNAAGIAEDGTLGLEKLW